MIEVPSLIVLWASSPKTDFRCRSVTNRLNSRSSFSMNSKTLSVVLKMMLRSFGLLDALLKSANALRAEGRMLVSGPATPKRSSWLKRVPNTPASFSIPASFNCAASVSMISALLSKNSVICIPFRVASNRTLPSFGIVTPLRNREKSLLAAAARILDALIPLTPGASGSRSPALTTLMFSKS